MIPLTNHVSSILSQQVTGTDDKVARVDTKKAFLTFLNTVMSSNLGSVFVSQSKHRHNLSLHSIRLNFSYHSPHRERIQFGIFPWSHTGNLRRRFGSAQSKTRAYIPHQIRFTLWVCYSSSGSSCCKRCHHCSWCRTIFVPENARRGFWYSILAGFQRQGWSS
jgi:hypothetical protein